MTYNRGVKPFFLPTSHSCRSHATKMLLCPRLLASFAPAVQAVEF